MSIEDMTWVLEGRGEEITERSRVDERDSLDLVFHLPLGKDMPKIMYICKSVRVDTFNPIFLSRYTSKKHRTPFITPRSSYTP